MPQAVVVSSWEKGDRAFMAVRVTEADGDVEYVGSKRLADLDGLSTAQKKAAMVAEVKAVRDACRPPAVSDLKITGTVTV